MGSKLFSTFTILLLLISNCLINGQFLRIDTFDDAKCSTKSFASKYIQLNNCVGQYIYRYVPSVGAGSTTTSTTTGSATGAATTLTGLSGMTNPLTSLVTTAGTLSTVDITGIVTQAITLGMTGGGNLNVAHLESAVTGSAETQSPAFSTATAQSAATVESNPLTSTLTGSNPLTSASTGSDPLTAALTGTTTSNPLTSASTGSNPLTSASGSTSSILTNSGLLTTAAGITSILTGVISSSLTTGSTGNVQGSQGVVSQFYCLSVGCAAQCVEIFNYPIGVCIQSGLDNVIFSVAQNLSNVVTIANETTNPGTNNGFCQTFSSPSACLTTPNEITQFENNHCGKGIKTNCTSNEYNSFKCVDAACTQCTLTSTFPLNQCILNNNTGTTFKSILKTPIVTLPNLNSSSSHSSSHSKPSSSDSVSMFTYCSYTVILLFSIAVLV